MNPLYLRWAGVAAAGLVMVILGIRRYDAQVKPMMPEDVLRDYRDSPRAPQTVRVLGMVEAGSLVIDATARRATFRLIGKTEQVPVRYTGAPPENLRELKHLVAVGRWDPSARVFETHEMMNLPNYDFIAAAYLLGLVPIGLFLFRMERRVRVLYNQIKEAKVYGSEQEGLEHADDQG